MNRLIMTACAAISAVTCVATAEEFGSAAAALPQNGEAIAADQEVLETVSAPDYKKTATDMMNAYIKDQRKKLGKYTVNRLDAHSMRAVVSVSKRFTIPSQEVTSRYLDLRRSEMMWLLLGAKGRLARLMGGGQLEASRQSKGGDTEEVLAEDVVRGAERDFVGCTVLKQFDSCVQNGDHYDCEIAILYSWSKENETASAAIQMAFDDPSVPAVKLAPGKRTVDEWLSLQAMKGALGEWIGPRRYVDNEGEVWFLGISALAYDHKSAERQDDNEEATRVMAETEVAYSLFSSISMNNAITNKTIISKLEKFDDLTTEEKSELTREIHKYSKESSKIETAGMSILYEGKQKDASGQDIYVAVAGVSLGAKRDVLGLLRDSEDIARKIKESREREKAARVGKVGRPKPVQPPDSASGSGKGRSSPAGGRLGLGARFYDDDDE
ncbi:MAG: hypothetical protein K6F50_02670 [Kiritimatiellae bacterium]|nr:hypothetical protein [Kiritimatiellia bacterium]